MKEFEPSNFSIQSTPRGPMINLANNNNICTVLFYQESCHLCEPYFKLFQSIECADCEFAVFNVSRYAEYAKLSLGTKTPLQYTPYIVVYINGRPYTSYNGPPDEDELKKLIGYLKIMQYVTSHMTVDEQSFVPIYKI